MPSRHSAPPRLSRLCACVAPCLFAVPAIAAESAAAAADPPPQVRQLPAVEVNAARGGAPRNAAEKVASTFTLSRQQLDRINIHTSEDALKFVPNLHVRMRFSGDDNGTVSVRGTSTRQSARTLVYADGLLLSNLLGSDWGFAPRWSMVAPEAIESVRVLYGPYSARYPGNALGATVLIETRMPERLEGGGSAQFFRQSYDAYGHSSDADGRHYSAWVGDRRGAWSWRLVLDRLDAQAQPMSYYSALQSNVAAGAADTPVAGAVPYRDQNGRAAWLFGVNSEGIADTVNDQAALRVAWDFAPDWQAALNFTDWRQHQDKATGSWLRDADGNVVSAGDVAIDGWHYALPANAFAPSYEDSERRLYGLSLRSHRDAGWNLSLTASRFDTPKDVARTAAGAGAGPGQVVLGDGTGWDTFDVQADYRAGPDAAHVFSLGAHMDEYTMRSRTSDSDDWRHGAPGAAVSLFAGKTRTQALYVEDDWRFAPDWRLVGGLRYERWRAFDGERGTAQAQLRYPQRDDDFWSPKLSLLRDLGNGWRARLSLARAYRLPTVGELFQGSISGTVIVNNDPNLKPEDARSRDLSLEREVGGDTLRLTLYEDDVRDTLFSQTNITVFPSVTSVQNVDRVRTRGVEAAWQARDLWRDGFDLSASVAFNDAKTLQNRNYPASVGKRFYRIPRWRADAVASYRFNPVFTATLAGRYSGRQYNSLDNSDSNPDTFGGTSRYLVFDARVQAALNAQWQLALGVENLTDERYFVYHPYPGRTWTAEARYRF